MSTPGNSQSSAHPARSDVEAASFRRQSEVSATVKPLNLRGGQSPASSTSPSQSPRHPQSGAFTPDHTLQSHARRRLSTDTDASPSPVPGQSGSGLRVPGRRLSGQRNSPRTQPDEAAIPALYNTSVRSSSHPHPIRLRVPKSEEREELTPDAESPAAFTSSPQSAAEGWSGKLKVPITRRSAAQLSPISGGAESPVVKMTAMTPGASLIQEALAARGLLFSQSPPATAAETPMTDTADSVEVSRLTANTHGQDENDAEGNDADPVVPVSASPSPSSPRADQATANTINNSFNVSETSAAITPSPGPRPRRRSSSSPPSALTSEVVEAAEEKVPPAHDAAVSEDELSKPAPEEHKEEASNALPAAISGKPPLHGTPKEVAVAAAPAVATLNDAQPSRSRSGSGSAVLLSPNRSPEKSEVGGITEIPMPNEEAPASRPSPQLESDRVSYASEELKYAAKSLPSAVDHETPPAYAAAAVADEEVRPSSAEAPQAASDEEQEGEESDKDNADAVRTATPTKAQTGPRGRVSSTFSGSSSSGSSFSPRLGAVAGRRPTESPAAVLTAPVAAADVVRDLAAHTPNSSSYSAPREANEDSGPVVAPPPPVITASPDSDSDSDSDSDLQSLQSNGSAPEDTPSRIVPAQDMSFFPAMSADIHTEAAPEATRGSEAHVRQAPTLPLSQPSLLDSSTSNSFANANNASADADDNEQEKAIPTMQTQAADSSSCAIETVSVDASSDDLPKEKRQEVEESGNEVTEDGAVESIVASDAEDDAPPQTPLPPPQAPRVLRPAMVTATMEEMTATSTLASESERDDAAANAHLPHAHPENGSFSSASSAASFSSSSDGGGAALSAPPQQINGDPFDEDEIESVPDFDWQDQPEQQEQQQQQHDPARGLPSPPRSDSSRDDDGVDVSSAPVLDAETHDETDAGSKEEEEPHAQQDQTSSVRAAASSDDASSEKRDAEEAALKEVGRSAVSSIPCSDGDDVPTYPSALSEKRTHPAARSLFQTRQSDSASASASENGEEEKEDDSDDDQEQAGHDDAPVEANPSDAAASHARTPASAGRQSRSSSRDSASSNASKRDVEVEPMALGEVEVKDVDDHAQATKTVQATADKAPEMVASGPPRMRSRFALSSSSSSSSDVHEQLPEESMPLQDTDALPANEKDTKERGRQSLSHSSSSSSSSEASSSGSVFHPHQVEHGSTALADEAPLVTLAQTSAAVELADLNDEDEQDEDRQDIHAGSTQDEDDDLNEYRSSREGHPVESAETSTHEAYRSRLVDTSSHASSKKASHDGSGGAPVSAPLMAPRNASTPSEHAPPSSRDMESRSDEDENEDEDEDVPIRVSAHPFSPAGRRAQREATALSVLGGGGATPSMLPPDSILFHTAQSSSSVDEEPEALPPRRAPQDISMEDRRQRVMQGYLDDIANMESDQRALLVEDYVTLWRRCVEEEAVARGALPQRVASSKLLLSDESSHSSDGQKPAVAAAERASCGARMPPAASSSSFAPSSSSSSSSSLSSDEISQVCAKMDTIQHDVHTLANNVSEALADEQVYRRYVEEKEMTARSLLSRLARCDQLALNRAAITAQEESARDALLAVADDAKRHLRHVSDSSETRSASCSGSLAQRRSDPVCAEVRLAADVMLPGVLITKEPLERDDIATAEADAWLRLRQAFRVGLAALIRLRDEVVPAVPVTLSAYEIAETQRIASEESLGRDVMEVRESRDRVVLTRYHQCRVAGSSPSSAVNAAAHLLASLSLDDDAAEDVPEFFEWNPTSNTSGTKTATGDSTVRQDSCLACDAGVESRPSRGVSKNKGSGLLHHSGAPSTSSPSPRVHSSLLLTSSDPSQEDAGGTHAAHQNQRSSSSNSRRGNGRHAQSSGSHSGRRSPTVVANAQTETAALLRSMQNARKIVAAMTDMSRGVRRSHPIVASHTHDGADTEAAQRRSSPLVGASSSGSGGSRQATHAQNEGTWRSSLRSEPDSTRPRSAPRSASAGSRPRSENASAAAAAPPSSSSVHDSHAARDASQTRKQLTRQGQRRRPSPRLLAPPPLLSRHAVPCSYCNLPRSARATGRADCSAHYHQLLRQYGQEAADGSPARSASSCSRTPRSPSMRPYSDSEVFDTPSPHSTRQGREEHDARHRAEDKEPLYDDVYGTTSPTSAWSVEAIFGSPGPRSDGVSGVREALVESEVMHGARAQAGDVATSVQRVLYPPEQTFLLRDNETSREDNAEAAAVDEGDVNLSHDRAEAPAVRTPSYVEVIRRGPVREPSVRPPVARHHGLHRSRSATQRPDTVMSLDNRAEEEEEVERDDVICARSVSDRMPHYAAPTTLSITREQDEKLLQAIYRARGRERGGPRGARDAAKTTSSEKQIAASSRVRCSKTWSWTSPLAAATPVVITRLPLEDGPGVWMLDNTPRTASPRPSARSQRALDKPKAEPLVCVAAVGAVRNARASPAPVQAHAQGPPDSAHDLSHRDARLHGSLMEASGAGFKPSSRPQPPPQQQTDVDAMAHAFREWAQHGGVGVVQLPASMKRDLPVPMRAALPAPAVSPVRTTLSRTALSTKRTPVTRKATPPALTPRPRTPKYSYVDRFYKQSPEQVAKTVSGVCAHESSLHEWQGDVEGEFEKGAARLREFDMEEVEAAHVTALQFRQHAALWPPERSHVYEGDEIGADENTETSDVPDSADYAQQYWQQRRDLQTSRASKSHRRPLFQPAEATASSSTWTRERSDHVQQPSSHFYVGRQGAMHVYS